MVLSWNHILGRLQPNDTATLSIEDVKLTGLGEYVLKTHNVDSINMLTAETQSQLGLQTVISW